MRRAKTGLFHAKMNFSLFLCKKFKILTASLFAKLSKNWHFLYCLTVLDDTFNPLTPGVH